MRYLFRFICISCFLLMTDAFAQTQTTISVNFHSAGIGSAPTSDRASKAKARDGALNDAAANASTDDLVAACDAKSDKTRVCEAVPNSAEDVDENDDGEGDIVPKSESTFTIGETRYVTLAVEKKGKCRCTKR